MRQGIRSPPARAASAPKELDLAATTLSAWPLHQLGRGGRCCFGLRDYFGLRSRYGTSYLGLRNTVERMTEVLPSSPCGPSRVQTGGCTSAASSSITCCAERVRLELTRACTSPVFETGAVGRHSACLSISAVPPERPLCASHYPDIRIQVSGVSTEDTDTTQRRTENSNPSAYAPRRLPTDARRLPGSSSIGPPGQSNPLRK